MHSFREGGKPASRLGSRPPSRWDAGVSGGGAYDRPGSRLGYVPEGNAVVDSYGPSTSGHHTVAAAAAFPGSGYEPHNPGHSSGRGEHASRYTGRGLHSSQGKAAGGVDAHPGALNPLLAARTPGSMDSSGGYHATPPPPQSPFAHQHQQQPYPGAGAYGQPHAQQPTWQQQQQQQAQQQHFQQQHRPASRQPSMPSAHTFHHAEQQQPPPPGYQQHLGPHPELARSPRGHSYAAAVAAGGVVYAPPGGGGGGTRSGGARWQGGALTQDPAPPPSRPGTRNTQQRLQSAGGRQQQAGTQHQQQQQQAGRPPSSRAGRRPGTMPSAPRHPPQQQDAPAAGAAHSAERPAASGPLLADYFRPPTASAPGGCGQFGLPGMDPPPGFAVPTVQLPASCSWEAGLAHPPSTGAAAVAESQHIPAVASPGVPRQSLMDGWGFAGDGQGAGAAAAAAAAAAGGPEDGNGAAVPATVLMWSAAHEMDGRPATRSGGTRSRPVTAAGDGGR